MSLTGKIMDFFADKAMTIPAFPRTKVKAVSDDNNVGLNVLLDNKLSTSGGQMNGSLNMNNNIIWNLARPVAGDQAANKQYVDDAASQKLHKAGDSMEGALNMNGHVIWGLSNPTGYDQPVTYRMHVDDLAGKLSTSGGTLTGDLNIGSSVHLSSDAEGGNIRINPPSGTGVQYWEADAYNGDLRVYGLKDDGTYLMQFSLGADGSVQLNGSTNLRGYAIKNLGWCSEARDAAPKEYVDNMVSGALPISGGTMTGTLNMNYKNLERVYGLSLCENGTYGTTLPPAGTPGRIFFKKVSG